MKTTFKHLASATFIALLLTLNIKAEGTDTKALNYENMEAPLQLENWMTNEMIWNANSINTVEFVQEPEATLKLEDWMISDENWKTNYSENETEITVEPWMTSENFWK